jgi:hypothetical protein
MAGVVAALSVTSDLTRGHPHGEAMRACLLATELARRADLPAAAVAEVYYATLMRFAGCAATSHEAAAALGGDDVAVRARGDLIDATRPAEALRFLASLGHGAEKARVLAHAPRVPAIVQESARADCEVGADLVRRLRLPDGVRRAVLCASSCPTRTTIGPQLSVASRAVHLALDGAHAHGAHLCEVRGSTRAGLAMFAMRHGLAGRARRRNERDQRQSPGRAHVCRHPDPGVVRRVRPGAVGGPVHRGSADRHGVLGLGTTGRELRV